MKLWIIAILILLFALALRLWNFGEAGRWSDEQALMEHGYNLNQLIKNLDFSNPFWYKKAIDHPPLAFYFYGLTSKYDYKFFALKQLPSYGNLKPKGSPVFTYDLPYSRAISVVASLLSILLVFFIGVRFFSLFIGILSTIILSMLPHFLGYSQFVDLETWVMLSFTACVFTYLLYLEKNKLIYLILTGILAGISLEVKESNMLIFAFYFWTYFLPKQQAKKKSSAYNLLLIVIIAFFTCFVIWPMPILHFPEYFKYIQTTWLKEGLIPERIFGRVTGARAYYYVLAFFITTPAVLIALTFLGMKVYLQNRKNWKFCVIIIWFFVPLLMSFFHVRQHMVRYIIEFYAPLSILSAIGFEYIINKFTKNVFLKYLSISFLIAYLSIILINIAPFYLEYYNELVGGTKNVYEKKLFLIGWFGEGLKEPGIYIAKNAKKNSIVGLAINPSIETAVYTIPELRYEKFNPANVYDFIIVNYYNVVRIGFDEKPLKNDYKLVYTEKADGADFVHVYKHK